MRALLAVAACLFTGSAMAQSVAMTGSMGSKALLVVNIATGQVERTFKTELEVSHMLALSTDRTRIYCSNMRDGSVSAFDFKTG